MLMEGLSAVAAHLDARDAASAATVLVQAMKSEKESLALVKMAQGLTAVAARMKPRDGMTVLVQAVENANDPLALTMLAKGLPAIAARMDAKDAAAAAAPVGAALAQVVKDGKPPLVVVFMAQSLAAVAGHSGRSASRGRRRTGRNRPRASH